MRGRLVESVDVGLSHSMSFMSVDNKTSFEQTFNKKGKKNEQTVLKFYFLHFSAVCVCMNSETIVLTT